MKDFLNAKAKEVIEMKINGQSFFGQNVTVSRTSIVIDGVEVMENTPKIQIEILGGCEFVSTTSGDIIVQESAQEIKTVSGDIECGNVIGSVSSVSGDVKCGDVSGHISTMSGDIRCNKKG